MPTLDFMPAHAASFHLRPLYRLMMLSQSPSLRAQSYFPVRGRSQPFSASLCRPYVFASSVRSSLSLSHSLFPIRFSLPRFSTVRTFLFFYFLFCAVLSHLLRFFLPFFFHSSSLVVRFRLSLFFFSFLSSRLSILRFLSSPLKNTFFPVSTRQQPALLVPTSQFHCGPAGLVA